VSLLGELGGGNGGTGCVLPKTAKKDFFGGDEQKPGGYRKILKTS